MNVLASENIQNIDEVISQTAIKLRQNGVDADLADALARGPRHRDAYRLSRFSILGAPLAVLALGLFFFLPETCLS